MNKYIVSPSPHIVSPKTTRTIMLDVLIALIPAFLASIIFFGPMSILITAVCIVSCVVFEKLISRDNSINDLSAVVTGVLLAFNLPVSIPIWICVIGSFFAIVVVKQLFGGIGQNFANPAITGRIFLFISFATHMTNWTRPFEYLGEKGMEMLGISTQYVDTMTNATSQATQNVDAMTVATPLVNMQNANTLDLFLGNVAGCLGETSALALLLGGAYLVIRKVISPVIPVTYISVVFIFTYLLGENPLNQIFAGGLMLGAIFMATDYATTPSTKKGQFIFAIGCGIITVAIRMFGNYPEGVSFAILFMNIVCPLIDRYTMSKPFGIQKKKRGN